MEFVTFMRILTSLPSMNTLIGRQQLVDIVADQADLNSAFNVCVSHANSFSLTVVVFVVTLLIYIQIATFFCQVKPLQDEHHCLKLTAKHVRMEPKMLIVCDRTQVLQ